MKNKKIVLLTLLIGTLSACTIGAETIARAEANLRVAEAFRNTLAVTLDNVEANATLDGEFGMVTYLQDINDPLSSLLVEADATVNAKAKGLTTDSPELALKASAEGKLTENGTAYLDAEGSIELYYTDEWFYGRYELSAMDEDEPVSVSDSSKSEVGPLEFEQPTFEDFFEIEGLARILDKVSSITAKEKNDVLEVTYEVKKADIVPLAIEAALQLTTDVPTTSEINHATSQLDEIIDDALDLRTAKITIKVKNELIYGLKLDVDLDLNIEGSTYEIDPETYQIIEIPVYQKLTFDLMFDSTLKINETINMNFPDFTDFEEEEVYNVF